MPETTIHPDAASEIAQLSTFGRTADSHTVHRLRHGVAITGKIPLDEAVLLMKREADVHDFDTIDARIAKKIGAGIVLGCREELNLWRAELGLELMPADAPDDRKAVLGKLVDDDTRLVEVRETEDGGVDAGFSAPASMRMIAGFCADLLTECGAANCVQQVMRIPAGDYTITVQRNEGKTPLELRSEMQAERDQAVADRDRSAEWYQDRWDQLHALLKAHGGKVWDQACNIMANGKPDPLAQPNPAMVARNLKRKAKPRKPK